MQTLLLVVAATRLSDEAASLDLKVNPVTKVIGLLKQMQSDLQKEADNDKELYEKLSCWCQTNEKEKTQAIADGERKIDQLESDIDRLTAKSGELGASIATLDKEIAAAKSALAKASAMRAEELAEFNSEEKDLIQSIRALDGAITTLAKHQSFLQGGSEGGSVLDLKQLRAAVKKSKLLPSQASVVQEFLAQPAGFKSYSGQSGAIFGILSQMKETFENNMSQSQKDEMAAAKAFADLKAAKTSEINAATKMVDSQTQELADTDEANAAAKQNLEDTKQALVENTAFLADVKKRCANADAEYEQRCKDRNAEIQAVSETIGILDSDESHDLMGKTLGFVQKAQWSKGLNKRQQAARVLSAAAEKTHSSELAQMALSMQLDAFVKVQAAIDEMVTALKKEMDDEVKHRDFCIKALAENDQEQAVTQDEISDLTAELGDLDSTISTLTDELKDATSQVAETKRLMQRASEDRELENKDFQEAVADQRAVQAILKKAAARLQQTYGDGLAADAVGGDGRGADDLALLQQTPAGDAKASAADAIAQMDKDGDGMISEMDAKLNAMTPPQIRSLFSKVDGNKDGQISQEEMAVYKDALAAQQSPEFSSYKKQDGRGVMGLIEGIIAEARAMELEAIKAEHDSQTAYEEYMKDSNKSIKTLNKAITDKTERKAAASARNTEAKSDRSKALDNADSLEKHKKTLHQSCDFVLNNFDARQEARGAEIRALGEAKAILSGA